MRNGVPIWKPTSFDASQDGHGAEQFRTLRSRLYHLRNSQPLRTLLVTSSMAGEGKTFVTGNLVRAILRQSERRVLVVDADLRRPRLHMVFGAPTAPGLSDYLRGSCDEPSIIPIRRNRQSVLHPQWNPGERSERVAFERTNEDFARTPESAFDWVIIDSPPCLPVADAGVIAQWWRRLASCRQGKLHALRCDRESRQELKGRNVVESC